MQPRRDWLRRLGAAIKGDRAGKRPGEDREDFVKELRRLTDDVEPDQPRVKGKTCLPAMGVTTLLDEDVPAEPLNTQDPAAGALDLTWLEIVEDFRLRRQAAISRNIDREWLRQRAKAFGLGYLLPQTQSPTSSMLDSIVAKSRSLPVTPASSLKSLPDSFDYDELLHRGYRPPETSNEPSEDTVAALGEQLSHMVPPTDPTRPTAPQRDPALLRPSRTVPALPRQIDRVVATSERDAGPEVVRSFRRQPQILTREELGRTSGQGSHQRADSTSYDSYSVTSTGRMRLKNGGRSWRWHR